MRRNIAPVREPVFDAHIEITGKDGRKVKLPLIFDKTTRPWAEFFANLASQSAAGHEAEISEDLFAAISPTTARPSPSDQDLFGGSSSATQLRELSGFARHFLFMGA